MALGGAWPNGLVVTVVDSDAEHSSHPIIVQWCAIAAFIVGYTTLSVPLRTFGIALIIFYLAGSRATKVGKTLKKQLEEGHQDAGYRNAAQVLCNSLTAALTAVLWSALHFACCLGDTLASELGILSRSPPILITTLKTVPPGTNGGLSLVGTLASLMGGLIMGVTMAVSLLVQSTACRSAWSDVLLPLVLWGTAAGGLGSLLDSLLGATLQCTRFLNTTKRILTDEAGAPTPDADVKIVSGYDILTNNQVNLISSIITAVLLGALA
ncbi:hypothetical protein ACG7TL_002269 [Trametes sanguinea]